MRYYEFKQWVQTVFFIVIWCVVVFRYKRLLAGVDLSRDFFYSHTYPLMHTLQHNMQHSMQGDEMAEGLSGCLQQPSPSWRTPPCMHDHMFVWNAFLAQPAVHQLHSRANQWTVALVHGFFQQVRAASN